MSQTETSINETNDTNEWIPTSSATTNDIPTFMPIPTTPTSPIITTNIAQKLPIPSTTAKDE